MDRRLLPEQAAVCRPKRKSLLGRLPEFDRDVEVAQLLGLTTQAFYALPEDEIDFQVAAWERKKTRCPQCKGDIAECSDHTVTWYPQRTICYPSMANAAANRRYDEVHQDLPFHDGTFTKWAKESSLATPYHYREGVNVWVADVDWTPDDDFLTPPSGGRHAHLPPVATP